MRLLAVPFLLMLAVLVAWPFATILKESFYFGGQLSLKNYATVLSGGFYLQSFTNAILISLSTTAVGMVLGFLVAVALRQKRSSTRLVAMAFANIGSNLAGVPLAMAVTFMFGLNGMFMILVKATGLVEGFNVYTLTGLFIAYSYFQVTLATIMLAPLLDAVGRDLEEAATLVGVGTAKFWWRVGIPVVFWQLLAIAILLFANAMGTYATIAALTGTSINLVTIRISQLVSGDIFSDPNLANALAILLLIVLLVPITLSQIAARRGSR